MLDRDDMSGALKDFYRPSAPVSQRVLAGAGRPTPIEFPDDADTARDEGEFLRNRSRVPVRKGLVPRSKSGRILLGAGLVGLAAALATAVMVRSFLLHDPRFRIESSSSVQIVGNSHVTRPELLSTFGEDIGRNIFYVSLAQRRASLEALPWVERATVMRLLPDRLRVSVIERTPVAFVRQGNQIGLVDAHGVLLDMPPAGPRNTLPPPHYSFPVLVGISASEPLSTREARMKIFQGFVAELDATGEGISSRLSEIDLSEPEDVRALVFDKDADILVHFGDTDFLDRFHSFQAHLPEWRQQYPKLASVDMRYPRQVVLEMQPGSATPQADAAIASNQQKTSDASPQPLQTTGTPAPQTTKAAAPAPKSAAAQSAKSSKVPAALPSKAAAATHAAKDLSTAQAVANTHPEPVVSPQAGKSATTTTAVAANSQDPLQAADATLATRSAKPAQQAFHWIPKAAGKHSAAHPLPASQQASGGAAQ